MNGKLIIPNGRPVESLSIVPPLLVPRILLGTPYYGPVSMGLFDSLAWATVDTSRKLWLKRRAHVTNSVLPHAFNQLLALALDERDKGDITHFAMCHSDIIATPGWLDVLWAEMAAHDADLVSAVVPIKEDSTRTSTAIGLEADPWQVVRSVHLEDRGSLPETFGPEEACRPGEVLLVNTGLFLADLRKPWWDDFAFGFQTRIRKGPDGRIAESRPEDWELSRHLHQAGARVRATWKVQLGHEGSYRFPNFLGEPAA